MKNHVNGHQTLVSSLCPHDDLVETSDLDREMATFAWVGTVYWGWATFVGSETASDFGFDVST